MKTTANDLLEELKSLGNDNIKKVLLKHGIPEPCLGVKVEYLKRIQKRIKKNYQLALDLYDTGVYDAMYLAGLIADDATMTKKDLQRWADRAKCYALCGSTVAWVAAESQHGREMAMKWIESNKEIVAAAGWATLSSTVAIRDDDQLDLEELKKFLKRVERTIHDEPDRVRHAMNGFVIAVGSYVTPLSELALTTAEKIGQVTVDMGQTACRVPFAPEAIRKVQARGVLGKKRKTAKC